MRELSLFSGAGGGVWGTKLLGWKTLGYVEFDPYCQKIIAQRIKDGLFDRAPIFGDIRAFLSEGYAERYMGLVDIVTAGFPCQPFSAAGKRLGEDDPRNMWPATAECIAEIRPRHVLLENVPGLTSTAYFGRIIGMLTELGYDCKWTVISAAELGAPQLRKRLWIYANTNQHGREGLEARYSTKGRVDEQRRGDANGLCLDVSDANSDTIRTEQGRPEAGRAGEIEPSEYGVTKYVADTAGRGPRPAEDRCVGAQGIRDGSASSLGRNDRRDGWWQSEPDVGRVANGVASRGHRLRALGNGQVPRVVVEAWERLSGTNT